MSKKSFNQLSVKLIHIYLIIVFSSNFSIFAQTRKVSNQQSSTNQSKTAPKGSAAWTGIITYTRTQTSTDLKTVDRVSGRGQDTRDWEMKYDYKAQVAVIESPERTGTSIGRASINHNSSSTEKITGKEKNSCDRGKTWQEMTGTSTSKTETTGTGKVVANVNIGINTDGTYSISVGLPQIKGKVSGSQTSSFSGQCTAKEGKNLILPPTETTIDGQSLTSDGSHRIDPSNPDRLSGTYSLPLPGNVTETISWNLQKGGGPLRVTDLRFEHPKFPNWDDWQEIVEQTGTVDGNLVKVKAKVLNLSSEAKFVEVYFKETYKGDKWDGAKPDLPLNNNTVSLRLDAGEEREVETLWNTGGYAWYDDGRPRLVQRVKAEVWENYKKQDEMTKNLKVAPKPIIFVAGIWTKQQDFEIYQNLLTISHSFDWKTYRVIDTSSQGTINGEGQIAATKANKSVYDNADILAKYVTNVRTASNAWHVDMLAHSTGGLVARLYVHKEMEVLPDNYPVVKHLMMLGVPNNGVPCADSMANNGAFRGQLQTAKELMPDEMKNFNQYVTNRKGTKFSALVGDSVPLLCASPQWNDGFVSVDSAKYGVSDYAVTKAMQPDLIGTKSFNDFIKPHVVTGPRGTYPLPVVSEKGGNDERNAAK